ncbi:MAG: phytanoyl-CoA dioxygenase family protein [Pseudomonadota bacterium]
MLTDQDKRDFVEDGVICLRNALSADEIAKLSGSVDRQIGALSTSPTGYDFEDIARQIWTSSDRAVSTQGATRFDMERMRDTVRADDRARPLLEDELQAGEGCFFYDVAAWKHDHGVRQVAFDSALPALVADLLDTQYLNFWEDTTFVKGPRSRQKTAFHQDLAYFQIAGDHCVIVWIPLDPACPENGVVEYVRGSHKWNEVYAPNVFISQTPIAASPEQRCPDIEGQRENYDIISFDVEPGDVIIHHVLTIHGAGGNMTDQWRRAMSFRYCGDRVRYFDRPGAIPQVGVRGDLENGDRLFSRDYPVVWPKPWPEVNLAELYRAQAMPDRTTTESRPDA